MSRLPEYCECSKPDSQKRCRIYCGKPPYPACTKSGMLPLSLIFDEALTIPDSVWDTISQIRKPIVFDIPAPEGYEPMRDADGNPLWLMGYPVYQKKKDEDDG